MANLYIYKASAGSGKTFTLAVHYIHMLLQDPMAYRHILAVTFTNKATAEMKQRILGTLYGLAHDLPDTTAYYEKLQEMQPMDEQKLRSNADKALRNLIHDYTHFRVETIDSFFQSVLRSLARELDLGNGMTIELNTQQVISDAVDEMLRELTRESSVLSWITEYIGEEMEEGNNWNVTDKLKKFARNIHVEAYQRSADTLEKELSDGGMLHKLHGQLRQEIKSRTEQLVVRANEFFQILDKYGFEAKDLFQGLKGVYGYYQKIKNGRFEEEPNSYTCKVMGDASAWASGSCKDKGGMNNLVIETLYEHLLTTERMRLENTPIINTCTLVLRNMHQLQLINHIHHKITEMNKRENRFLLADTNNLLNQLQEGDTSFVFEKMGYFIEHIMIDEFQDTAGLQWENFKPLMLECLSNQKDCLVVGDVKQAIYRWRGSDWRILNEEVNSAFGHMCEVRQENLDTNRRSLSEVITFNNMLFVQGTRLLEHSLQLQIANETTPDGEDLKVKGKDILQLPHAYEGVTQKSLATKQGGCVQVIEVTPQEVETDEGTKKESADEAMYASTLQLIEELLADGIPETDIAILTRKNGQISGLASYIAQRNPQIHIVSGEAFQLSNSIAVNMLIDALRWLNDEQMQFALVELGLHYHTYILNDNPSFSALLQQKPTNYGLPASLVDRRSTLLQHPLYEMVEEIYRILELQTLTDDAPYLFTFFDRLLAFCENAENDLGTFLQYWDDELADISIPAGSNRGITAMTIHKSKGLEFKTVIVPFCEWKFNDDTKHETLWIRSEEAPYHALSLLPVEYCGMMNRSLFTNDYNHERIQKTVDSLNLLYVTCTRPKENLFLLMNSGNCLTQKEKDIAKRAKEKADREAKKARKASQGTTADDCEKTTQDSLPRMQRFMAKPINYEPKTDDNIYDNVAQLITHALNLFETGKAIVAPPPAVKADKPKSVNKLMMQPSDYPIAMYSTPLHVEFRQSNLSQRYIRQDSDDTTHNIDRGTLLHYLFSLIGTAQDIDTAIQHLVTEGIINTQDEQQELHAFVEKALSLPQAADWFSGRYELYNECNILYTSPEGKPTNCRPDRVMRYGNHFIVVDFKFGKPLPQYEKQVRQYMQLIHSMGPAEVEGYLWYVDNHNIVPVHE